MRVQQHGVQEGRLEQSDSHEEAWGSCLNAWNNTQR
jgi:hypothetical protein